jgi:hypothetical protein
MVDFRESFAILSYRLSGLMELFKVSGREDGHVK